MSPEVQNGIVTLDPDEQQRLADSGWKYSGEDSFELESSHRSEAKQNVAKNISDLGILEPLIDRRGNLHDPVTGRFVSKRDYQIDNVNQELTEQVKLVEESKISTWEKTDGRLVQLSEEEAGVIRPGVEFETTGDVLDWSTHEQANDHNRRILLTAEDGSHVYIRGNVVVHYRIDEDGRSQYSRLDLEPGDPLLPATVIGETWQPGVEWAESWYLSDANGDKPALKITKALMELTNNNFLAEQAYHDTPSGRKGFEKRINAFDEAEMVFAESDILVRNLQGGSVNMVEDLVDSDNQTSVMNGNEVSGEQQDTIDTNEQLRRDSTIRKRGLLNWLAGKKDGIALGLGNYFNDEDKGRRRKVVAVAGVVTSLAAGLLATKYGFFNGDESQHALNLSADENSHHAVNHAVGGVDNLSGGGHESGTQNVQHASQQVGNGTEHIANNNQAPKEMTLRSGHTIWGDTEKIISRHNPNLSYQELQEHTQRAVDATLKANGINYDDARYLASGYHYKIPHEVIEEILNNSKA